VKLPDNGKAWALDAPKTCTKCSESKPLTDYCRSARSLDGRRPNCKACQAEYRRGYYADADERASNLDREKARMRAWYRDNRERAATVRSAHYRANTESHRIRRRAYDAANPDKKRASIIRRRRLVAEAKQEPYTRAEIFERDGWVCQLCGQPVDPKLSAPDPGSASIDHVIPLSLGGDDTPANVQLAHFGCNSGKCNRVDGETA